MKEICGRAYNSGRGKLFCYFYLRLVFAYFLAFGWADGLLFHALVNFLGSRQMKYLNFCGEVQEFKACYFSKRFNRNFCTSFLYQFS